eukprot:CAMPEP_0206211386 /NCGR_PEP_ID=MMETSP0166-20121206/18107_1 /ASSEMBLY_ACC=CAM_ASM_000260 /TAXON_ID=95228 /ORGANISM="Vannella robusta, Strain DIVA3 518/3/11/1/6" /LENGTH=381 /DNA_ID=CAMNT_0053633231 /DNA_START=472 /DNA_END=1617 /DNA_ORIENTATION=-
MENYKESQRSPIFPQFLDLVHQLLYIYPTTFEFNELLLLTLMEELYSCRYGNFLFDSHKQRQDNHVFTSTKSLWTFILAHADFYSNPNYRADPSILLLDLPSINLRLWKAYFVKFHRLGAPHPFLVNNSDNKAQPAKLEHKKSKRKSRRKRRSTTGKMQLVGSISTPDTTDKSPLTEIEPAGKLEHKKRAGSHSILPSPRRKKKRSSQSRKKPSDKSLQSSPLAARRSATSEPSSPKSPKNLPPPSPAILSARDKPMAPLPPLGNAEGNQKPVPPTVAPRTDLESPSVQQPRVPPPVAPRTDVRKEPPKETKEEEPKDKKNGIFDILIQNMPDPDSDEEEEPVAPPPIPSVDRDILNQQFEEFQKAHRSSPKEENHEQEGI